MPIGLFESEFPFWEEVVAGTFQISKSNPPHMLAKADALIARHTVDLTLGEGDMAVWSNKGMLIHAARDGHIQCPEGHISRATVLNLGVAMPA